MLSRRIGSLLPSSWHNYHHCYHRLYTTSTEIQNNEIITSIKPTFHYTENQCTRYLKVRGPDTIPFLNGLCTSKLQPHITKKNLTTISPNDQSQFGGHTHASTSNPDQEATQRALKMLDDLDVRRGNWGIYKERGLLLDHSLPFVSRFGQYTGFLNSTGILITDSIIYPTPVSNIGASSFKYPEFLVGFDLGVYRRMVDYFRGHILMRKVKIEEVPPEATKTWDVMIGFGRDSDVDGITINPWLENLLLPESSMRSPSEALEFADGVIAGMFPGHEENVLGVYPDTRSVGILEEDPFAPLSFRIVTDASVDDITTVFNAEVFPVPLEFKQVDSKFFRRSRLVNGFVDGVRDIEPESVLPLELNFDYYPNVVSVDKGCYVGQELLTRSFSTGILRKRSIPVRISNYKLLSEYLKTRPEDAKPLEVQMMDPQQGQVDVDGTISTSSTSTTNSGSHYNPFLKDGSQPVRRRRNRPVGTLLCAEGDIGLVRLRTEHFPRAFGDPELQSQFYIELDGRENRVELTPIRPFWLSEWLSEHHGIHTHT